MTLDEILTMRIDAIWCRTVVGGRIDERLFALSREAHHGFRKYGRCVVHLGEESAVPLHAVRSIDDIDVSKAIEHGESYDPDRQGTYLWVPTTLPEDPSRGIIVAGRFELHPAFRAS